MERMTKVLTLFIAVLSFFASSANAQKQNLLLNSQFDFHVFNNHRKGHRGSYKANNVAFWNSGGPQNINVYRESHVDKKYLPTFSVKNAVQIPSGKKIWQFFTLPEASLAHGDKISLSVYGWQAGAGALQAEIKLMKLDSEDGTWKPSDFGMRDKRSFPKHSRGELVVAKSYSKTSDKSGLVQLTIDGAEIIGHFSNDKNKSHSADVNTIGIRVEFTNTAKTPVWVYSPCLSQGVKAVASLPPIREMIPYYRHIPRITQKLWKGEPVHIIIMGSSIDRGSANPPMYPYDEDPKSPKYKQPLSDAYYKKFSTKLVGRPELEDYFAQSRHYFSYGGRLKRELMNKFNMPANKILINFMACDGSCVGEAHSGLKEYCSLALPPSPNDNGHKLGKSWQQLYPALFARPEGARPDLVIFGSGANEKTDTPDEIAVFEGTIRWIQRHYPNTEFLFCMFQNKGSYTPNPGDMEALSLRYQIPYIDYAMIGDLVARWCKRYTLVPRDGHPQAACHYLWFKQLEKAFENWSPTVTGQAQLQLPERIHKNTYGWEGEMLTFSKNSPRIFRKNAFILEDTAFNSWGEAANVKKVKGFRFPVYVDGKMANKGRRNSPRRNVRNSLFCHGRLALGDRHVFELGGKDAGLNMVDSKVCPNRNFIGVGSKCWNLNSLSAKDFQSKTGAPYGNKVITIPAGKSIMMDAVGTDFSIAYVDSEKGGELKAFVDGKEKLKTSTNIPFKFLNGDRWFMENRKGINNLPYGLHKIRIEALKKAVNVLGVFVYDSRPNKKFERRLNGIAAAGETINFTPAFKAPPIVICNGGLKAEISNVTPDKTTFTGTGTGYFEVIGE
jgi:hypothetical protein